MVLLGILRRMCFVLRFLRRTDADIVSKKEFTGVNKTDITDFASLRSLGDELVGSLVTGLKSSGSTTHRVGWTILISMAVLAIFYI